MCPVGVYRAGSRSTCSGDVRADCPRNVTDADNPRPGKQTSPVCHRRSTGKGAATEHVWTSRRPSGTRSDSAFGLLDRGHHGQVRRIPGVPASPGSDARLVRQAHGIAGSRDGYAGRCSRSRRPVVGTRLRSARPVPARLAARDRRGRRAGGRTRNFPLATPGGHRDPRDGHDLDDLRIAVWRPRRQRLRSQARRRGPHRCPSTPFASFNRPADIVTAALDAARDRILAEDAGMATQSLKGRCLPEGSNSSAPARARASVWAGVPWPRRKASRSPLRQAKALPWAFRARLPNIAPAVAPRGARSAAIWSSRSSGVMWRILAVVGRAGRVGGSGSPVRCRCRPGRGPGRRRRWPGRCGQAAQQVGAGGRQQVGAGELAGVLELVARHDRGPGPRRAVPGDVPRTGVHTDLVRRTAGELRGLPVASSTPEAEPISGMDTLDKMNGYSWPKLAPAPMPTPSSPGSRSHDEPESAPVSVSARTAAPAAMIAGRCAARGGRAGRPRSRRPCRRSSRRPSASV